MLHLLILLATGVFLGIYILGTQAICNVCATGTNVACISNTSYQYCSSSLPFGPVSTCPTGYYCTANDVICNTDPAERSCIGCGTCNDNKTFACLTARTFALCLGTTTPSQIVGNCGLNYVCDFNNPDICGTPLTGSQATCPYDNVFNGTAITPTTICSTIKQDGRFPYGTDLSTSCKQYIYCFLDDSNWRGGLYTCPGSTYFDSSTRFCGTAVPAGCTSGWQLIKVIKERFPPNKQVNLPLDKGNRKISLDAEIQ
ncbi:uncharacterized protein LOC108108263 [Drosophila eugracilis]|uniref:uncharacterized protein LOC108108263 n=1 Tax=Drosophila eugracilis TaxID=29029 RepID=UPI001BD9EB9B|nr:uncharacterized protein LOC108108263 [Drosophila eugracilis]